MHTDVSRAAVLLAVLLSAGAPSAAPPVLTVSVAASLADVMKDIGTRFQRQTGQRLRLNVAGSNFLARQIVEGARVDVFVSADAAQMDVVERAGRVVPGTRADVLTNQLVVVGPPGSSLRVTGARDLAGPSVRRLALGNPDSVPAGVYARQWLERAGVWSAVQARVVPTLTVRAALAAVRAGHADAAVVYRTDARTESSVPTLYVVPVGDAPPVRYPVAAIAGPNREAASQLVAFLRGSEAGAVFEAAGFGLVTR